MSSAVANPDSSIRMAESTNGISRALTTKPGAVLAVDRLLAERALDEVAGRAARVSSEVSRLGTSSTSCSTGTGLKKWMPITCCGRDVTTPSFMIGIEEVLDARIASGSVTISSRRAEQLDLGALVLDDRLDDQLPVGELARAR